MKKFLILAIVVLMMVPALAKNMAEGRFGVGLELGSGASMLRPGNALGLGLVLQYGITGLTFQGYFDYDLPIQPEAGDPGDAEESTMTFGVDFLGTVGDGPFVGYAGLGFFYKMMSFDAGIEGFDAVDTSTYGLNLSANLDYFLTDMIALGFKLGYPISLGSDDGGTDEYDGMVNAAGMNYKVAVKFFF